MAIKAVARLRAVLASNKEQAGLSKSQKFSINQFVVAMKRNGLTFVKSDILVNQRAEYVRLTIKKMSNSGVSEDVFEALKAAFPNGDFKYSKYKVGGILPYMHWELQTSADNTPQTIVLDADWH